MSSRFCHGYEDNSWEQWGVSVMNLSKQVSNLHADYKTMPLMCFTVAIPTLIGPLMTAERSIQTSRAQVWKKN